MIDVVRPPEAPASLAAGTSWSGPDVLEALHATFLGKCYLCESPLDLIEVDHRRPKDDDRFAHLRYAWDNLFPTCGSYRCNNRRARRYPDGGLLDPGDRIETRVVQRIDVTLAPDLRRVGNASLVFEAVDPADTPAANTAEELDRIHNATGSTAVNAAKSLRFAILEQVTSAAPAVIEYVLVAANPAADPVDVARRRSHVAKVVSRHAPFTMLVRSYFHHLVAVRALFD